MVTNGDARYILSEIKAIPYYEEKIDRLRKRIAEIQTQIDECTSPVSPNGGEDVLINGKIVRVKIPGNHSFDSGKAISNLITKQEPLETSLRDFEKRWKMASWYKKVLIEHDETSFSSDFFAGKKSYRVLQDEYGVSNAYDRMIRIVRGTFKSI